MSQHQLVTDPATGLTPLSPFDFSHSTVLLTGGSSGIGYGLVQQLILYGCKSILITGRNEKSLKEVQSKHKEIIKYYISDSGNHIDRESLYNNVIQDFPQINVLINNAGIQRQVQIPDEKHPINWPERQAEIDINISGPIHTSELFAQYFRKNKNNISKNNNNDDNNKSYAIAIVTSGLAFFQAYSLAVYSATKAAAHSYVQSLRYVLEKTNIRVVEIIPPVVKSNLGGNHNYGEDCDEYCADVIKKFVAGEVEIGFKASENMRKQTRAQAKVLSDQVAQNLHAKQF